MKVRLITGIQSYNDSQHNHAPTITQHSLIQPTKNISQPRLIQYVVCDLGMRRAKWSWDIQYFYPFDILFISSQVNFRSWSRKCSTLRRKAYSLQRHPSQLYWLSLLNKSLKCPACRHQCCAYISLCFYQMYVYYCYLLLLITINECIIVTCTWIMFFLYIWKILFALSVD